MYRDANGTESTLTKVNAEVDPVFTPPASPHGSDEEDDGVNLEGAATVIRGKLLDHISRVSGKEAQVLVRKAQHDRGVGSQ